MSDFVIHGLGSSPFMRAVEITLIEKGADYRIEWVSATECKQQPYLSLQPFGKIPAFQHGDFQLFETQAIIRYIDALIPSPPLQPKDARLAARMNQIIGINDCYYFPLVARGIVFNRLVAPRLLGLPVNEEAIAAAIPHGELCMAQYDRLLGDQPFFAGDALSLADILVAPQLAEFIHTQEGEAMIGAHPRLHAWLDRMNALPSMVASLRRL